MCWAGHSCSCTIIPSRFVDLPMPRAVGSRFAAEWDLFMGKFATIAASLKDEKTG